MSVSIEPQLAVFLDNRPGVLARVCQALAKASINIRALSILDTVDHAIVRMIVDRPREAEQVLAGMHTMLQRRDVLVVTLPSRIGALADIAQRLTEAGINLEYAYCTAPASGQGEGVIVLRTNDLEATVNALS